MLVGLVQNSPEEISTPDLEEKTGFAETKIWSIIARANKAGCVCSGITGIH